MAELVLEVCVDSLSGLMAAVAGGADRIELCAALGQGGLTPSAGMMVRAARVGVPVHALIRARGGDFVFGTDEVEAMCADIGAARAAGLAGVVIGAARADGTLDNAALARLVEAAAGMAVVLNRVFDLVPDRAAALEAAVRLGIGWILTSGGAVTAAEGAEDLRRLIRQAAGRIVILPAGGITAANARTLIAAGACELHASCSRPAGRDLRLQVMGFAGAGDRQTDETQVRALKAAMSSG